MKKLLTVTGFTAMLTLLRMAAGFLVAKVVAVYAGPTGMAMLGQIQNVVSALNGIVTAPAGNAVVRFTAQHHQQGFEACAPWWRASFKWVGGLLLVVMPAAILSSSWLAQQLFDNAAYGWLIVIISLMLPFSALGSLINSVINGQQLYRRYVALGFVSVLVSSSVMIGLIITQQLQGALIAASLQTGLIGLIMLLSSLRQPWFKLKYWWGETGIEQKRAIGGYMAMALTSAICVPLSLMCVRNILVTNVGWEQAGHWQAVWKISEVYLSVVTMALGTYYLPKLASLQIAAEIKSEVLNTIKVILPLLMVASGSIYLLRDVLINLLFTADFYQARDLFALQLSGDVIKIASWLYAYPMLSKGLVGYFMFTEIFFSALLVVAAFFLVPVFGVKGACLAYFFNYFACFLYIIFIVKPECRCGI